MRNAVLGTFMCGASELPCAECHPSCLNCDVTPGICQSCRAGADAVAFPHGQACRCIDGKGTDKVNANLYHEVCSPCSDSCATCFIGNDDYNCYTCKVSTTELVKQSRDLGSCSCRDGYQPGRIPVLESDCVPCVPAGCPACVGPTAQDCFSSVAVAEFARLSMTIPLPETTATHICYCIPLDLPTCASNVLVEIMGSLADDGNGVYQPQVSQCYTLLNAMWPYITYWFTEIFPTFDPAIVYRPKSFSALIVKLWILEFTPSELVNNPDWKPIVTAFNQPAAAYANYLAWIGTTPGYTLDGTSTHPMPAALAASGSISVYIIPFLSGSKVCDTSGCSMQAQCALIMPGLECST